MPFKSKAQAAKLNAMAAEGKFPKDKIEEYNKASEGMELPERVAPKKPMQPQMAKTAKTAKKITSVAGLESAYKKKFGKK